MKPSKILATTVVCASLVFVLFAMMTAVKHFYRNQDWVYFWIFILAITLIVGFAIAFLLDAVFGL